MKLTSLELVFNPSHFSLEDDPVDGVAVTVARFLRRFQDLEDLYLMLPQPTEWNIIADGILNHLSTLRRLVTHDLIERRSGTFIDGDVPWSDEYGLSF